MTATSSPSSPAAEPTSSAWATCGATDVPLEPAGTLARHQRGQHLAVGADSRLVRCEGSHRMPYAAPAIAPREVPDGDGVGYVVYPGVLDDGAKAVYCSGAQSLALARHIHDRSGWPVLVSFRTGPDPLLHEDEWATAERYTVLYDAYAVHPDGHLATINGRADNIGEGTSTHGVWEFRRELVTDADRLVDLEELCEQDLEDDMAVTFVTPVLTLAGPVSRTA